jgi:two-component system phosphate regulon response regulator PhoB
MNSILIIQDSPSINLLLESMLSGEGFSVSKALSGEEGLKLCVSNKFDLILLDYMMPGLNGIDTCKILRSMENTKKTPIILISALEETELNSMKDKINEAGFNGIMQMPFKSETVLDTVRSFIHG